MLLVRNGIVKCKKKPASSIDEFVEKERELNYQLIVQHLDEDDVVKSE
jgi:hypothetical protein